MCTHIIGYTGQRNCIKKRNEASGGNKDAMFQRIREWLSLKNYQYQVTTGIYMLEPWERTIFSILCYVNFFIPVWVTPVSWITYASNIYILHTIAARTCCYMCSNEYSWRKFRFFGQLLAHFSSTIPRSQFSIVIRPWSCNLGNFGGIFFESEAYPHTLSCTGTMKEGRKKRGHPFISHLVSYFRVLLFPSAPFDEISIVVKAIYFFHFFLYPRTVWNMKCGVSKKSYPFVQ